MMAASLRCRAVTTTCAEVVIQVLRGHALGTLLSTVQARTVPTPRFRPGPTDAVLSVLEIH